MKAGVALGSNLGNRLQNLRMARKAILQIARVTAPVQASAIYETEPVDCEEPAEAFFNAVLEFDFAGDAMELWQNLKLIEISLGRPRERQRNVSRGIDIDLLYFGELKIANEQLQLPHPRMHLRRFVLAPLAEIRPELVLPDQVRTVSELLASADASAKVFRLTTDWTTL